MRSAYLQFERQEWCRFRLDTPLTLTEEDLKRLRGKNDVVSLKEVEEIYLPLSRLLNLYVTATQQLHKASSDFLGNLEPKVPYIIGLAGSVAVGKSTAARILQALLTRWPNHPRVELITTDGFLYPNKELERRHLMNRKGFPESYDIQTLLKFLYDIKSGRKGIRAPVYSHHYYDIVDDFVEVNQADIVIVEGLNILQSNSARDIHQPQIFVSDFFDFTMFIDAQTSIIEKWYIERLLSFYQTSFQDPTSYFHYIATMSPAEVKEFGKKIWQEINEVNLNENILPFKNRAQLILQKNKNHAVEKVYLRKL